MVPDDATKNALARASVPVLPRALDLSVLGGLPEQWPSMTRRQQVAVARALAEARYWLAVVATVRGEQ